MQLRFSCNSRPLNAEVFGQPGYHCKLIMSARRQDGPFKANWTLQAHEKD